MSEVLQIEFPFVLPCGLQGADGKLHREGMMRRATARDELAALAHPLAKASEPYLHVVLISRVVRLGALGSLSPNDVESLFASDFSYLQELYMQVNGSGPELIETRCPTCGTHFMLDLSHDTAHD